jgi:hemolysin III
MQGEIGATRPYRTHCTPWGRFAGRSAIIGFGSPLKKLVLYRDEHDVDFALGWFVLFVTLVSAVWLTGNYFLWNWVRPDIAQVQISSPWWTYLVWFSAIHAFAGLFEFFFHRYVLHSEFWRPLGPMKRKHTEHHSLTHVRELRHTADASGKTEVRNKYPILSPEQIESSAFPAYALAAFLCLFSILLVPLQFLIPSQPILLSGYLAFIASFSLYEIKHAIEHMDYDKHWRKWVEKSRFVRNWYGFHLMHHARIRVNQAIGGVYALPLWDWVFGTYYVPEELPLPGERVNPESLNPPHPRKVIVWLDEVVNRCEKRIVEKRKAAALANAGGD